MLTDDQDYLAHAKFYLDGEYDLAIESLRKVYGRTIDSGDSIEASYLLQRMGDIYFLAGDRSGALREYFKADDLLPRSLVARLKFIDFLNNKIGDAKLAADICVKAIRENELNPIPEEDRVIFGKDYLEEIKAILNQLEPRLP